MILLYCLLLTLWSPTRGSEECPAGCYCHPLKNVPVPDAMLPFGHTIALKVNCHALADPEALDFSNLPENTIHLDLAKYGLKAIDKNDFVAVPWLEKLDLQGNQISSIQEGSFIRLKYLEILDLSRNNLRVISPDMFDGLVRLSRLKLNDNSIMRIEKGSLEHLNSLTKLELADNQFLCDCHIAWFLDYIESFKNNNKNSPLANPLRTKCALPIHLADVPLKRLRKESLLDCDNDMATNGSPTLSGRIEISPEEDIIAFKGDILKIVCEMKVLSSSHSDNKIFWNLKGKSVASYSWSNISVNEEYASDTYRSILTVHGLDVVHSGDWLCKSRHSSSSDLDVLVIPSNSQTCTKTLVSKTVKGEYEWKPSLGGHTQRLPCQKPLPGTLGFAYRVCRENGQWDHEVNVSQCAYTSPFTDSLRKFALMNTSTFDRTSLFESAAVLRNFTSHPYMFKDVSDLDYFARAVDNYVPFMDATSFPLADVITDMIANILGVDPDLLLQGERQKGVVTKLRNVLMNITSIAPDYSYHKKGVLVVSTIPQSKERTACSWSENDFECSEMKAPESYSYKSSATLVSAEFEANHARQPLRIVTFGNSSLFISKSQEGVLPLSSYVLGIWSTHKSGNTSVKVSLLAKSAELKYIEPVTWNGERWVTGVCSSATIIRVNKDELPQFTFSCPMTGFFALKGIPGGKFGGFDEYSDSSTHQSVSHFGSVPILLTLIILIAVYGSLPLYTVSKKIKICLLNLWISSAALIYFFVGGTYLTDDNLICSFVGILLHFTTLSTLMWFFVSINTLYTKVSSRKEDKRPSAHFFLPSSSSMCTTRQSNDRFWFLEKRSFVLLRYYLLGWGLPLVFCLVSGAADLSSYRGENYCFMKTTTFLGLLIVPWALITALILGFSLSTYCLLHSPPSHITEHATPSHVTDNSYSEDKCSVVSLSNDFGDAKGLLRALLFSYCLFSLTWISGACSVICPISNTPDIEGIAFAILYIFFGVSYAFFNAAYYAFARRELGAQCLNLFRSDVVHNSRSNDRDDLLVGVPTLYKSETATDYGYLLPRAPPPSAVTDAFKGTFKEEAASSVDYASNNVSHLRRGYVAPVNSEAEYSTFAAIRKDNPRTSSPAPGGSLLHYPQTELGGISPLYNETVDNNNRSLNSVITEEYTGSSTIKMGDPCKLFSLSQAGLPPENYSSLPRNSSVSRRQKRYRRYRSNTAIDDDDDEDEDTRSRSTVYSGKSSKKRHKRPNRRRPRSTKETTMKKTLDQVPEVLNSSQYSSSELNKRETSV